MAILGIFIVNVIIPILNMTTSANIAITNNGAIINSNNEDISIIPQILLDSCALAFA